jgi:hypothetical protein
LLANVRKYYSLGTKHTSSTNSQSINKMSVESGFNGAVVVTELLSKTLENAMKDLVIRAVKECSTRYGFDFEDAIRALSLDNIKLLKKPMAKRGDTKRDDTKRGDTKRSDTKRTTKQTLKSKIPFPFSKHHIDTNLCQGLTFNHGLFTQCKKNKMDNGNYCNKCQTEADSNASGEPNCGTIDNRINTGLMDFRDPKGRKPVSFLKLLEKLNITREIAEEEAMKIDMTIDEEHFVIVEQEKKKGGRPKKTNKVVEADDVEDLFAKLTEEEETTNVETNVETNIETNVETNVETNIETNVETNVETNIETNVDKKKRVKLTDQEKEQKRLEKEEKRLAKEQEKEQKRLEKEQQKLAKEQEKEQKRLEKEQQKLVKEQEEKQQNEQEEEEEEQVKVSRFTHEGKKYLKSTTNILYDPKTQEEVGIYDPISKTIQPLPQQDDDEEEEENYDYDN